MNLGHPAAEALQLMREGEREGERGGMKAQFDHSSLATSATATERERDGDGERGKSPSPRQRQQQQTSSRAVCISTRHAASPQSFP